jgi:hypothetical protein
LSVFVSPVFISLSLFVSQPVQALPLRRVQPTRQPQFYTPRLLAFHCFLCDHRSCVQRELVGLVVAVATRQAVPCRFVVWRSNGPILCTVLGAAVALWCSGSTALRLVFFVVCAILLPARGGRAAAARQRATLTRTHSKLHQPPTTPCLYLASPASSVVHVPLCRCVRCALCENLRAPNRTPHPSRCALPAARCLHL